MMSTTSRMPSQSTGKTVLLSASIPPSMNEATSEDRLHVVVEEAIISIGRAAFARRIRVAYGGAPHLALLLAGLAGEYALPRYAEGPNVIREDDGASTPPQLVAYISHPITSEQGLAEDVELLARTGIMAVRWSDEGFVDPFQMVRDSRPDMLVCIGGDSETAHTVEAYRELRGRTPIYVMATTGGISERFAQEASDLFRPFDRQILRELQEAVRDSDVRSAFVQGVPPYPLIMQRLMDTLTESNQFNLER